MKLAIIGVGAVGASRSPAVRAAESKSRRSICENLQERCGVRGDHLMVSKSRTATGGVTPDPAPRG
jgi:hypothetical protein